MKNPLLHGLAAAVLASELISASNAQSVKTKAVPIQEASHSQATQIRVQVEFIDVSHEQFTELMFGAKLPANGGELRQQVAQLIKDGKATVVETMLCTAKSGQKATSESVEEIIYPTEYEPAELPNNIQIKEGETGEEAEKTKGKHRDGATGPTPTAFDTRNVGSTLEIEPTLERDDKTIDLRFVPEIVYHVGNQVWAEWKGEHGNSPIQMPTFYSIRTNTAVTLTAGHYMMTAGLSPKNKEGVPDFSRKLMVFVKADIIKAAN